MISVSCNSDLATVEGRVTHDGKPLANAKVVFVAPGRPMAVATTDDDGHYQVRTGSRIGIAPGNYKVAVSAYQTVAGPQGEAPIPVLRTPPRYNSADHSGLAADVQNGRNSVDFELSATP